VVENLIFNVAQLLKEPIGAVRVGQVVADLRRLAPDLKQVEISPECPAEAMSVLEGPVRLMHTTGGVLAQGRLHAVATLPCSRCLEPISLPLDIELEEVFAQTVDLVTGQAIVPEEEDRALWIDSHHILDLSEVLRQDALVAVPMHPVCRSDCRGLCLICGENLNRTACDCAPEPDPRWAALATLLETPK
jgi:uncharacterized protein